MKAIEKIKEAVKALAVREATLPEGNYEEWRSWFEANERFATLANSAFEGGWRWLKEAAGYSRTYEETRLLMKDRD